MKYTSLNENLKFSRIIAGCMRTLDAGMDGNKLRNFVHNCMDMGIDTFDHAPVYGAGGCEKIFGDEVLRKDPELRSKIKLLQKQESFFRGRREINIFFMILRNQIFLQRWMLPLIDLEQIM